MRRLRAFALVLLLPLAVAACSSGDGDAGTATTSPPGEPAAGGVTLADFAFSPDPIQATSGQTLAIANEDQAPHTFTVVGTDVDVEIAAGEQVSVTLDLDPGTYEVICRFHEARGMTATLKVG